MTRLIEKFRLFEGDEWFTGEIVSDASLQDFESYASIRGVRIRSRVEGGITGSATGYMALANFGEGNYIMSFLAFDDGRSVFGIKSVPILAEANENTINHLMDEFLEITGSKEIEGDDLTELYSSKREKKYAEDYLVKVEKVGFWTTALHGGNHA